MEKHLQNIELYLSSGGDPKLAARYKSPTLENRAKIKYLLSTLPKVVKGPPDASVPLIKKSEKTRQSIDSDGQISDQSKFLGLITQYPVDLHASYREAFSLWLQLCSLKLQLNEISADDESSAYEIQTEMLINIKRFDRLKNALDYYTKHKAVIATKSAKDFSKMSAIQLDLHRRNLASNICKRRKTLSKKESELPDPGSPMYQRRLQSYLKKQRELEEMILDEEKISELLVQ